MRTEDAYTIVDHLRGIAKALEAFTDMRAAPRHNAMWMNASEWRAQRVRLAQQLHELARQLERGR